MKYDNPDKLINDVIASFKMDNIIVPEYIINKARNKPQNKVRVKCREVYYGDKRRNYERVE